MSEAEREEFRAEMEERRKRFESMSDEEKEKFRAEMRDRFVGSRPQMFGRRQQLEAIAAIEKQLAKLKAAIESIDPNTRSQFRGLPDAERAKLIAKISAAMRDRQVAVTAIEQELAKLKLPGRSAARPPTESRPSINELRALHGLAVKEKATQTAKGIEKLMARYRQAPGRGEPRPRRERPQRPDRP
jgi:hypothetical protein